MGKKKTPSYMLEEIFKPKAVQHKDVKKKVFFLIVCEGEKTEPKYFETFVGESQGSLVYDITTGGGGINTIDVVNKAISLRDKTPGHFDAVWAVFDKDDFPDDKFNAAIDKCTKNDIYCAWSNQAFELWFMLHFSYVQDAGSREYYQSRIEEYVKRKGGKAYRNYKYKKNDPNTRNVVETLGDAAHACKYAERLYNSMCTTPARSNPCTTVYELYRQLTAQDLSFLKS